MRFLHGLPFVYMPSWLSPNSRGYTFRPCEPWGCKSLRRHQFDSYCVVTDSNNHLEEGRWGAYTATGFNGWVSPTGQKIPIGAKEDHLQLAWRLYPKAMSPSLAYKELIIRGWIRVMGGMFFACARVNGPSRDLLRDMLKGLIEPPDVDPIVSIASDDFTVHNERASVTLDLIERV